jgi:Skp family chaperone for outer membrane proteins
MKDWSDLEDKYQEMREKDSNGAEEFKKKMTERFQRTVQALEEESQAEKRQLQAMHQQRVISRINQVSKKKTRKIYQRLRLRLILKDKRANGTLFIVFYNQMYCNYRNNKQLYYFKLNAIAYINEV